MMPCSKDGIRMQEKNKEPDPGFLEPFCGLLANPKAASQNMSDSLFSSAVPVIYICIGLLFLLSLKSCY